MLNLFLMVLISYYKSPLLSLSTSIILIPFFS
ncbi:hypothetical protein Alsa2_CDS0148 [Staphylococcus phage Alsa_2]|nr:hypothetical protein Alsa2_CDS0148 [Staphylococcus phage Alsa_2]